MNSQNDFVSHKGVHITTRPVGCWELVLLSKINLLINREVNYIITTPLYFVSIIVLDCVSFSKRNMAVFIKIPLLTTEFCYDLFIILSKGLGQLGNIIFSLHYDFIHPFTRDKHSIDLLIQKVIIYGWG